MAAGKTFQLGGEYPRFETMSANGSKVFFTDTDEGRGGDLYVFDTATGASTDLTANHGIGEANAGVQDAVMGASEDGSYVYFVATGVLASGAVSGADNVMFCATHRRVGRLSSSRRLRLKTRKAGGG
jgi:Tol biopolymer transport system component